MKKLVLAFAMVYTGNVVHAQNEAELTPEVNQVIQIKESTLYGKAFEESGAISVPELVKMVGDKELENVVVYGKITEVCQAEGCWMRVSMGNDENSTMLVKFKDHSFFIPKDLAGRVVVFHGKAYQADLSVKMLKHYAQDAGRSEDEIAQITEPSHELAVEATGLIIK